jgi:beta-glucosidase
MGCGFPDRLQEAMEKGAVTRSQMETAARHILTTILRLDD